MKLFSIIVLLSIFFSAFAADLSLDGPHGDGRFLADPDSATAKPCESGKFNMLQFSVIFRRHDASDLSTVD